MLHSGTNFQEVEQAADIILISWPSTEAGKAAPPMPSKGPVEPHLSPCYPRVGAEAISHLPGPEPGSGYPGVYQSIAGNLGSRDDFLSIC